MRIRKTSQYIEGGATLSNTYGTSQEDGYSQEYINKLNTYSTDETRIGTWIDGKPLYRKVFAFEMPSSIPSNSWTTLFDYDFNNLGIITRSIIINSITQTEGELNFLTVQYSKQNKQFLVLNTRSITLTFAGNYYLITEYTKTTD